MKVAIIRRAERFSPDCVQRDAEIAKAVADVLRKRGCDVCEFREEDFALPADVDMVLHMCRSEEALTRLEQAGVRVVNTPEAVRTCCNRELMLRSLDAAAVPQPAWVGISTIGDVVAGVSFPVWAKRNNGATEHPGDVCLCSDTVEACDAFSQMAARGIAKAVLTRYIDGEAVRFFYVHPTGFFCLEESAVGVDPEIVSAAASKAAEALGLDVFGGNCVVESDGSISIVDVYDWPASVASAEVTAEAIADLVCN